MGDGKPRQKVECGKRRCPNGQYEDGYSIEQLHDHTTISQQFDSSCRCSVFGSLGVKVALAIAMNIFPCAISRQPDRKPTEIITYHNDVPWTEYTPCRIL